MRNFWDEFELRDGVFYYIGTDRAPDFTNPYWTRRIREES